jgi:hypothetical protein
MGKQRRRAKHRPPEFGWAVDLEMALRESPTESNAEFLSWLRRWRRRPGRVFWLIEADGRRRRLS